MARYLYTILLWLSIVVPALLALPLIIILSLHPMCVVAVKICVVCKYMSSIETINFGLAER